jgi:hypothetical protein
MRAWIAAASLAVFLLPTLLPIGASADDRSGITIYGPGTTVCHLYTSDQGGGGGPAYMEKIWVLGFMSAYNNYMVHNKPGLTSAETTTFFDWINTYCEDHPLDNLAVATAKLVEHIKNEE